MLLKILLGDMVSSHPTVKLMRLSNKHSGGLNKQMVP
ncbi:MAG: hypothetical protein KatS3mg107_1084 [Gemmataceae bacterium]|nr:MAG: hypothetical protein KatS3mg107_1084 [Gemmataceae bacterium]